METFVLTVNAVEDCSQGLRLHPGIRLSQMKDRPAIAAMKQGARLELRRRDGSNLQTLLVTYGVSVRKGEDGAFYMHDDPNDAEIQLTISPDVTSGQVPAGTEVWLLSEAG